MPNKNIEEFKKELEYPFKHNHLFFISGASGSGKTFFMDTISEELREEGVVLNPVISVTTRDKREGEVEGRDYYFVTKEEFQELKDNNALIESVSFGGNNYGITAKELRNKLEQGMAYIIVTIEGIEQISKFYHNWSGIFMDSSALENIERMRSRGDSDSNILKRVEQQLKEIKDPDFLKKVERYYEYNIYNKQGEVDKTLAILESIIRNKMVDESGD